MSVTSKAKWPALLAVLLAIAGNLVKQKPEVLLKVPHVGFILFVIAGGNGGYVPPFSNNTAYQPENFRTWARDGDVIVAVAPKSGTTWMLYCADAVRRKGDDSVGLPYTDVMYTTPWLEMVQEPGMTFEQNRELYNSTVLPDGTRLKDYWDHPAFPFRIFKSHFGPRQGDGQSYADVLPIREHSKVKYIAAARDPLEVAKSLLGFFANHNDAVRDLWGGFPPAYDSVEAVLKDLMPGGNIYPLYFPYVRSWWEFKSDPNVLLMHYRDMTTDLSAVVDKLSAFLGVPLTAAEKAKVEQKCSFKHMKEISASFDYRMPLNTMGVETFMKPATFINKGKSGEKVEISQELKEQWRQAFETELPDPKMRRWALEGGDFDA